MIKINDKIPQFWVDRELTKFVHLIRSKDKWVKHRNVAKPGG